MAKFKLILDRESCIGTFACSAEGPDFFQPADDGKVDLLKSAYNEEKDCFELMIDEEKVEQARDAASVCPVDAIIIEEVG